MLERRLDENNDCGGSTCSSRGEQIKRPDTTDTKKIKESLGLDILNSCDRAGARSSATSAWTRIRISVHCNCFRSGVRRSSNCWDSGADAEMRNDGSATLSLLPEGIDRTA
jgi:hypothetical protein